nr:hypothetical protein [Bacillus sp. 166amftsu]
MMQQMTNLENQLAKLIALMKKQPINQIDGTTTKSSLCPGWRFGNCSYVIFSDLSSQ